MATGAPFSTACSGSARPLTAMISKEPAANCCTNPGAVGTNTTSGLMFRCAKNPFFIPIRKGQTPDV